MSSTQTVSFFASRMIESSDGKTFTLKSYNPNPAILSSTSQRVGTSVLMDGDDSWQNYINSMYVEEATIEISADPGDGVTAIYEAAPLDRKFTYNQELTFTAYRTANENDGKFTIRELGRLAVRELNYGMILSGYASVKSAKITYTLSSPYKLSNYSPSSGTKISRKQQNVFSWEIVPVSSTNPPDEYRSEPSSATMYWRVAGSEDIQTVNAPNLYSVSIPANTFPAGQIEWCIYGLMANNKPFDTSDNWVAVTVTDEDAVAVATCKSPLRGVINRKEATQFVWGHYTETGTAQTKAEIQTSRDGSTYTTLATINGSTNTYTAPAGTLPSGDLYWRVRTYNDDNVAGAWSEPAHIVVYGPPDAPKISIDVLSPRPEISWQASEQTAYDIDIADSTGTIVEHSAQFGTSRRYKTKSYLSENHWVSVRIQNQYGIWSDYAFAVLPIQNIPAGTIALTAEVVEANVQLTFTGGDFEKYQIIRDGKVIGETEATTYIDAFANGLVQYQVRGLIADSDNFTLSDMQAVDISLSTIVISAVDQPDWVPLKYALSSSRKTSKTSSKSVTYIHYSDGGLPSAEIGNDVDMSYSLDCAFPLGDANAVKLEALLGQLVCVKEPNGKRYVGVLDNLTSETTFGMYSRYQASITLVEWTEGVSA
nr:MAG TPA: Oligo alginate lyase [Caudoviricetes sp.]